GVELYKALTPDKDGDGLAGGINLVTKKAPESRRLKAELKGDYNDLMGSMNQYISSVHYGERYFDGLFGVQLTSNLEKRIRSNERINVNYGNQDREDYFINDFSLEFTDEVRKREGLSVLFDFNTPDNGSIRLNNVYGRTNRDFLLSTRDYPTQGGGSQQGQPVFNYRDREQDINTISSSLRGTNELFGVSLGWGVSFAESQSFFPYDYQTIFVEPSGMNQPPLITSMPEQLINYAVNNFANASLYWGYFRTQDNYDKERTAYADLGKTYLLGDAISGEVKVGGKFKVKNRSNLRTEDFTPYYLGRWQTHERLPDGTLQQKDFSGTEFEQWRQSGGGFIGIDYFMSGGASTRNVYEAYLLNPLIVRDKLRQWRELNRYGVDATGNQQEIWVNPLIKYDDHFVTERVAAGYVMNTLNVGQDLTVIAGLRIENEYNDYQSTFMPGPVSGFPIPTNSIRDTTSSYGQSVLLPNLNISYRPFGFMNLRLAAYKALGRPDFNMRMNRFIAGRPAEVGTQFVLYVGNPSLKTSQAWNYEINTSFFDNSFGLISVSAYYKEIKDMYHMLNNFNTTGDSLMERFGITWKSQLRTTPYNLTLPYNSPKPTKIWGFEFEHQINFHFLPNPFNNIVLSYNASVVRSETVLYGSQTITYFDSSGPFPLPKSYNTLVERKHQLEGMPEFFLNIALGYDIGDFSTRLSLFHQGEHNISFSATGAGDRITTAFTRVDVTLKYKVMKYATLFLNLNNLTNIEDGSSLSNRLYARTLFDQSEKYGLTADFGVTLEL
ncbi:MAG TPA: TonB-dependent receptor, partial [Bacteroidota bacterium]